jgi:glutathione S-transferase
MAIWVSGQCVRLREVVLREKPPSLLTYSPKGTVPVLVLPDGTVIDESLDVMRWMLAQADPENWLRDPELHGEMAQWVADNDGGFKFHVDRYKYATRYDGVDAAEHRKEAEGFLARLEEKLGDQEWLFGGTPSYVDIAIGPFIRQFANTDRAWFNATPYARLQAWLTRFLALPSFADVMAKYPTWREGEPGVCFPSSER